MLATMLPWFVDDDRAVILAEIMRIRERRIDLAAWREGYRQGRQQGRREAWLALFAGVMGLLARIVGRSRRQ